MEVSAKSKICKEKVPARDVRKESRNFKVSVEKNKKAASDYLLNQALFQRRWGRVNRKINAVEINYTRESRFVGVDLSKIIINMVSARVGYLKSGACHYIDKPFIDQCLKSIIKLSHDQQLELGGILREAEKSFFDCRKSDENQREDAIYHLEKILKLSRTENEDGLFPFPLTNGDEKYPGLTKDEKRLVYYFKRMLKHLPLGEDQKKYKNHLNALIHASDPKLRIAWIDKLKRDLAELAVFGRGPMNLFSITQSEPLEAILEINNYKVPNEILEIIGKYKSEIEEVVIPERNTGAYFLSEKAYAIVAFFENEPQEVSFGDLRDSFLELKTGVQKTCEKIPGDKIISNTFESLLDKFSKKLKVGNLNE